MFCNLFVMYVADILRFDNTYSWARAKKIHYLVEVLEPDTEDFTNPNVSQASFEVKSDI